MNMVTTGDIAQQTGFDRDSVNYAIRKTGIEPVGRAGIVRLFSDSAVATVRDFLATRRRTGATRCSA